MVYRTFWIEEIKKRLTQRSILWLRGVRRSGKTFLCRSIEDVEYFDCELPSQRRFFQDIENALEQLKGKTVVLDEIHRLQNPSELLKIAADYFPETRIIATGSSTLGTSKKFKDTLSGRKRELLLVPMISSDLRDFQDTNLEHRFFRGGLPPFFISPKYIQEDYNEWLESFWAKDIQELFRVERRFSFLRFMELLIAQSGSMFEATRFAVPCEVSRPTINNYLSILEATAIVHVVRPFSSRKTTEIVSAPKIYAFDTGFVSFFKGWNNLRPEDMGLMWEHFVLTEMIARLQTGLIQYWRDKQGHEIDFIYHPRGGDPVTIECKYTDGNFSPGNLKIFRRKYPSGKNYVVVSHLKRSYTSEYNGIMVETVDIDSLITGLLCANK
ncbi:MAG: ATP-binding protein [Spirochaetia bacterium]